MPTYEYKCEACGEILEIFHGINEGEKRKCPSCGELKLKRLISGGTGVIFKGGGWPGKELKTNERMRKHIDKDPENKGDGSGRILGED